jgi:hypothetical protein
VVAVGGCSRCDRNPPPVPKNSSCDSANIHIVSYKEYTQQALDSSGNLSLNNARDSGSNFIAQGFIVCETNRDVYKHYIWTVNSFQQYSTKRLNLYYQPSVPSHLVNYELKAYGKKFECEKLPDTLRLKKSIRLFNILENPTFGQYIGRFSNGNSGIISIGYAQNFVTYVKGFMGGFCDIDYRVSADFVSSPRLMLLNMQMDSSNLDLLMPRCSNIVRSNYSIGTASFNNDSVSINSTFFVYPNSVSSYSFRGKKL